MATFDQSWVGQLNTRRAAAAGPIEDLPPEQRPAVQLPGAPQSALSVDAVAERVFALMVERGFVPAPGQGGHPDTLSDVDRAALEVIERLEASRGTAQPGTGQSAP